MKNMATHETLHIQLRHFDKWGIQTSSPLLHQVHQAVAQFEQCTFFDRIEGMKDEAANILCVVAPSLLTLLVACSKARLSK
jgi:hypothetical protein